MSADEETPVVAAEDAAPTNGEAGANNNANKSKKGREKKDEKPIEELFDLSKPIPKVWRLPLFWSVVSSLWTMLSLHLLPLHLST